MLYLTLLGMRGPVKHPRHRRSLPERGWIQFLLLRMIHESPMHGYQLVETLEDRKYVRPGRFETGSIYTILNRMEQRGLLVSVKEKGETGRVRRVYTITGDGEDLLRRGLESIIGQKPMMDALVDYYDRVFKDSIPRSEENGTQNA